MYEFRGNSSIVQIRMEQAEECLEAARSLLTMKKCNRSVVNRAYYAAFYAALALLQTQEKTSKKHIGTMRLIDSEFVKPGILPKQISKWLHQLFEARMEDDYQSIAPISFEDALESLETAEQFVQAIRSHLLQEGFLAE
ncbi:MAG: HEPN domain-containing protein [Thermodesulfobacteriota bacterium]